MRTLSERLKSRKLWLAIASALVAGLKIYYPDIPSEAIFGIVGSLMGYVAVEGAVDASGQLAQWWAKK